MNEEGAPFDSGFDDAGPFSDTPEAAGVPLDAALREFGPAAFEDLIPRLRALAADLDAAHEAGFIHGRLHPNKILVTDDATYLIGAAVRQSIERGGRRWPVLQPYTAPEVVDGAQPAPTSDQFSLAAIAYEWMFGRPIAGPADRSLEVRALPNVDRSALSKALTRALTREPFRRFASCTDFCDAVAASLAPSLPLTPPDHAGERVAGAPIAPHDAEEDPLAPFQPEQPPEVAPIAAAAVDPQLLFTSEESDVEEPEPELPAINPPLPASTSDPVRAWRSDMASEPATETRSDRARFSGLALILATLVGAVLGFAAGYMAKPRALQSAPPEIAAAGGDNELKATQPAPAPGTSETGKPPIAGLKAPKAPQASEAPAKIGRLLIRSTPSGANVDVDGVTRGVTPLALQELDLGAREITVSRRGYLAEQRRIVLTQARPSRSVEVRLSQQPTAAAPPSTSPSEAKGRSVETAPELARSPASVGGPAGKPAVTTGQLIIESRPIGAAVTINDKPSGTTPVVLNELPPGEYRVTMTLPGYRPISTTVRVVAGERARAAARLTQQEQE